MLRYNFETSTLGGLCSDSLSQPYGHQLLFCHDGEPIRCPDRDPELVIIVEKGKEQNGQPHTDDDLVATQTRMSVLAE